MNESLQEYYQSLPTATLLILSRRPEDYTEEAYSVLMEVLSARKMDSKDQQDADLHYQTLEDRKLKKELTRVLH